MAARSRRTPALERGAARLPRRSAALPLSSALGQLSALLRAMRPSQWTKNALVLLAAVFARRLGDPATVGRAMIACGAFCLAASAVYLLNDVADRERDRLHPRKRLRPIAAGHLAPAVALGGAAACVLGALLLAWALARREPSSAPDVFAAWGGSGLLFAAALVTYLALNAAYSTWLKHQVLWDVFIIAAGFALRALAGAFAAAVPISPWFYLCTLFLALVLALGKRRAELMAFDPAVSDHRANLREYSVPLLDQLMNVMVTCTLITYSLYTFQGENSSHALMVTIPIVLFGVFRYLYVVYVKGDGDRPDELLWRDPQILGAVLLCVVVILAVLYGPPLIEHHAL